jgi:hypothetical protein
MTATAGQTECIFCHTVSPDPCVFHRTDKAGFGETATLCRECIRTFMCEMAYTDRESFDLMVAQARAEQ